MAAAEVLKCGSSQGNSKQSIAAKAPSPSLPAATATAKATAAGVAVRAAMTAEASWLGNPSDATTAAASNFPLSPYAYSWRAASLKRCPAYL